MKPAPGAGRFGVGLVVLALAVHGSVFLLIGPTKLTFDEGHYHMRAGALLAGEGFVGSFQPWVREGSRLPQVREEPGALQPPAYVVLLAGLSALTGRVETAARLLQALLAALSVLLLYDLARSWLGEWAGRAAGVLAALYPNLALFSQMLFSETLFTFLELLALWLLARQREAPPGLGRCIAGGVVLGIGALTRTLLLYFTPILLAWWLWLYRGQAGALARAGAIALACLAVIAPWSVRNTLLYGEPVLIEVNGAFNVWRGNSPWTFSRRSDPSTPRYLPPFQSLPLFPARESNGGVLVDTIRRERGIEMPTDMELVRFAREQAIHFILSDPLAFLERGGWKLVDTWNPTSFFLRNWMIGSYPALSPAAGRALAWLSVLGYLLMLPLAALGGWHARRCPWTWLVVALVGLVSAAAFVAFGLTRYRLPAMPLLISLAGAGAARLVGRREPASGYSGAEAPSAPSSSR